MPVDLLQLPRPGEKRLAVRVTPAAERALRQGHPWVFDQAVTSLTGQGRPGDLAVVFDSHRRFLAIGLYDPVSPIRVRILQHGSPETIDRGWLASRLARALALRGPLAASGTTGYRLVHGENDGLPGMVIDRYAGTFVLKLYSVSWIPWLEHLIAALNQVAPAQRIVLRLSRDVLAHPSDLHGLADGAILLGDAPQGPVEFIENGLHFIADVMQGQKTGFFLDQRDNRARVERLAPGRCTLNVFAYSGGFSLYAARGGAPAVTSVDISAPALADATRNFALNAGHPAVAACSHTAVVADAFETLAGLRRQRESFDLVVVDPPAFAKRESEIASALQAYARLTELALGVTTRGGRLVLASCSSRVTADQFFATVHRAAIDLRRPLRELERTGHAIDHPIRFREGAYLKCLFAEAP